jgi:hypothetical protein
MQLGQANSDHKQLRGQTWIRPLFSKTHFVISVPLTPYSAPDFGIDVAWRVEFVENPFQSKTQI